MVAPSEGVKIAILGRAILSQGVDRFISVHIVKVITVFKGRNFIYGFVSYLRRSAFVYQDDALLPLSSCISPATCH